MVNRTHQYIKNCMTQSSRIYSRVVKVVVQSSKITITCHANRLRNKNHITLSTDEEKVFDKTQHTS